MGIVYGSKNREVRAFQHKHENLVHLFRKKFCGIFFNLLRIQMRLTGFCPTGTIFQRDL
jgi:hypothetical protein